MNSKVLWHFDARNIQEAQEIFQQIAKRMPQESIFMCLKNTSAMAPKNFTVDDMQINWQEQEQGWLFHKEGELKWRKLQSSLFRFVYLGQDTQVPPKVHNASERLEKLQEKQRQIIADRLRPPILDNKNKILSFQIFQYINSQTGAMEFWRHAFIQKAHTKERI
jgi:hypothetical protein